MEIVSCVLKMINSQQEATMEVENVIKNLATKNVPSACLKGNVVYAKIAVNA